MNVSAANFIKLKVEMTKTFCTFMIDSGSDISLFKLGKVSGTQIVDRGKTCRLTGITNGCVETFAHTTTKLCFENTLELYHSFYLVRDDFPIFTDGILGRDFLTKFKCNINYEYWLLNFDYNDHQISVPIHDSLNEGFVIPERSEVIRKINSLRVIEDSVIISQEIRPGIFCGNTIIGPSSPFVKFINTTTKPVFITNFVPHVQPLSEYEFSDIKLNIDKLNNRSETILRLINFDKNTTTILCKRFVEKSYKTV